MTVQELIEELQKVEDKTLEVKYDTEHGDCDVDFVHTQFGANGAREYLLLQ